MNEDERIRQRAHRIWVEEGKPEGRENDHWQMARQLIAIEDGPGDDLKPTPLTQSGEKKTTPVPRKKAAKSTEVTPKEKGKKPDKKRGAKSA